jgi:beta-glucanase (GH16 family)
MKFLVNILSLLSVSFVFSQSLPFDFSSTNQDFTGFSGSSFAFNTDPNNSSNSVGQFHNNGSDPWQGFFINLATPIDLDFQNTLSLDFYAFDPNAHNIVMKLEDGVNPDVQVTMVVPGGGGWTDSIVFNFGNAVYSSGGASVSATGTYNKLTLFVDGGLSASGTYLMDDISDGTAATNPNTLDVIYSNLVWQDEFNTPGPINSLNWHHQTQVIIPGVGWANGEEQHYTNRIENSFVDNAGFLHIVAKDETFTSQGLTKNYTSARLNSKFAFTYGRVDVRAKLPLEAGTWPAIWMLGKNINENGGYWDANFGTTNWPACGELDIMEHGIFPGQPINYINSAIHTPCCFGGNPNQGGTLAADLANSFHVYSINWSPNQITFLLDDVGFYTYNPAVKDASTWPFTQDQYILLNVAMGGIAGAVDPTFTQSPMIIDYVRVYQNSSINVDEQESLEKAIQIYPNPNNGTFDLNLSALENADVELFVSNELGQKIYESKLGKISGDRLQSISLGNVEAGIYFVTVLVNDTPFVSKLIIK